MLCSLGDSCLGPLTYVLDMPHSVCPFIPCTPLFLSVASHTPGRVSSLWLACVHSHRPHSGGQCQRWHHGAAARPSPPLQTNRAQCGVSTGLSPAQHGDRKGQGLKGRLLLALRRTWGANQGWFPPSTPFLPLPYRGLCWFPSHKVPCWPPSLSAPPAACTPGEQGQVRAPGLSPLLVTTCLRVPHTCRKL